MTTLLEDFAICLPAPLSATTCGICHGDESEHIEVALMVLNRGVMIRRVGTGVWNVESRELCHSEAI